MSQEYIEIRGARENNLKNVSLRIPKRKITIFTGVSGSGKSSIVFDTIAAEAHRQLNETFSMFVRNFLPRYCPAGRRRHREPEHGDCRRSETPGRRLALHHGHHHRYLYRPPAALLAGRPAFVGIPTSFRSTIHRACARSATVSAARCSPSLKNSYDPSKSLNEGALQGPILRRWSIYAASGFFDNDKKLSEYTEEEMDLLLYGKEQKYQAGQNVNRTYRGRDRQVSPAPTSSAT